MPLVLNFVYVMRNRWFTVALPILLLSGLVSCWKAENARVEARGLSLQSLSFESMDLAFLYGVENPFPVAMPSGNANIALVVADSKVLESSAVVPRVGGMSLGEGRFDFTLRFVDILRAVGSALQTTIPVIVSGSCRIETPQLVQWTTGPSSIDLPPQWEGTIPALLPAFRGFLFHPALFGPSRAGVKIGNDGPAAIEVERGTAKVRFEDEIVFQGDVVLPSQAPGRERELEMSLDLSPVKMGESARRAFASRRAQLDWEAEASIRVQGMSSSVPLRMKKTTTVSW